MNAAPGISEPATAAALQTAEALALDCITFDVAPGIAPSGKPPVRIFLGSEEAQQRAERIFLYTVRKFRDPARVYQVFLMKDLPGFDRRLWRTGFTQYRFAIPELAGGSGRAIYNDVAQIYLTDPAELFDLDMDDHGYLAVAMIDTSVALMDCARMLPLWNIGTARGRGKRALIQAPAAEPGQWGPLAAGWNARDFEYEAGVSKLLHYTTLHLQPWRPTPEAYSYHPHPLGDLWFELEREADAEDYQPFTRERPSGAYRRLLSDRRAAARPMPTDIPAEARDFLSALGIDEPALRFTLDAAATESSGGFNPALSAQWPTGPIAAVSVSGVLEWLTTDDIPWFLEAVFSLARHAVHLRIDLRQATAPSDRPAPARLLRPADWWRERLAAAAGQHPGVAWQLDLVESGIPRRRFRYQPADSPPTVWVLLGRHEGDNQQLLTLAEALGWPSERRKLVFKGGRTVPPWLQGASLLQLDQRHSDPLAAPWPDLVLASGGRSAPVARWIRKQSGNAARLVHLGRPRAPLDAFDLVVTTPQYRLPSRDNVLHNMLPLNRPQPGQAEAALARWRTRVEALPRPRIALLAGGNSATSLLGDDTARRIREQAEVLARTSGGSLLISTSPRTPRTAADILVGDSEIPGVRHRWRRDDPDNPYAAFLGLADEIIVTGDSASMLADACITGRPVRYVALPHPKPDRFDPGAFLLKLIGRPHGRLGERGTPRQQDNLGRRLDDVIASGVLRPPRDLALLHEALRWRGLARPLDDPKPVTSPPAIQDLERTVTAVRRLFLTGRAMPL